MENKKIVLHVGFHKSGSTLIQNYFEEHPGVFFSREILTGFIEDYNSEVPTFENELQEEFIFLSDMRLTVNSWGQTEIERINSEQLSFDEIRDIQKEIAHKLKQRFPSAEILITTREKEQLLDSLYSQYVLNGGRKSLTNFKNDSNAVNALFDYDFVENLYKEIFGSSKVCQLSTNELKVSPINYIKKVCAVFELPFLETELKIVNPSLSRKVKTKMMYKNRLVHYVLLLVPKSKRNTYFKKYIQKQMDKRG